ncbi:MAG: AMP-binding protein, partial [Bacteroidia bacterium]|nr:AMP-binding protein [Bacteroidia bacterium]
IRQAFVGGATILPHTHFSLTSALLDRQVTYIYGSTEAEPIATLSGEQYASLLMPNAICVGQKHPNIDVRIIPLTEEHVSVEDGDLGEIVVAGPHVLEDYFEDDESLRSNKFDYQGKRWHKTGDVGFFLGENLYYCSRKKYVWKHEGQLMYPLLFELFLSKNFPKVEGTWLHHNGNQIAFFSVVGKSLQQRITNEFPFSVDRVVLVEEIPRDGRHQSRINYERLIALL